MNSVRIVADSGCDIPRDLAAKYEITIVPLMVRFGQDTACDNELTVDEFWTRAARSTQPPGTAAPSPSAFRQVFQHLVDAGHDVVCITLPANLSGVFNTAWVAAQEYGQRVRVFDSGSMSVGMGLQALSAARQARAGLSLDAIHRHLEGLRQRTSVIFVLDTVEWARRGGRVDRLLPLIDRVARTFRVKPVMELSNGDLGLLGVTRSYRNALQRIEDEVRSRLPVETICTAYTRSRSAATELATRLSHLARTSAGELELVEAGPVFAAHAGPNAVGAALIRS